MLRPSELLDNVRLLEKIGPFRIARSLGKGGFAPVFLAKEVHGTTELRTVALKVFSIENATAGERARLMEEARALCRVEHPNVVRFLQVAEHAEAHLLAIAMENVDGAPLSDRLEVGPLSLQETLEVGRALASALGAVHKAGLVHRDLKPNNVVLSVNGPKLIDFGIAADDRKSPSKQRVELVDDLPLVLPDDDPAALAGYTLSGNAADLVKVAGTLGYMDPACVGQGSSATPASDLYALGVTLFECLTGFLPARVAATTKGLTGLKGDVLDGRTRSPTVRSVVPELPSDLADIIDSLLDPEPNRRPKSAAWVASSFERLIRKTRGLNANIPPESVGPFRGLASFESTHQGVFFGREAETASTISALRTRGVVALVGASGSGKSSLARAGILPEVTSGALGPYPASWESVTLTPGRNARDALEAALGARITRQVADGSEFFDAVADATLDRGLILLIDQLEELAFQPLESAQFMSEFLIRAGERVIPTFRIVVTVRRDMLDGVLALASLGSVITQGAIFVQVLTSDAWLEVVVAAFGAYSYTLDQDLRQTLRRELSTMVDSMPLVQFALHELWAKRDAGSKHVTKSALEAIGGLSGALARHTRLATNVAIETFGEAAVRDVLLALTTAKGTRLTRTASELAEERSGVPVLRICEQLEERRLLVCEEGRVTLAHDALVEQWPELRQWVRAASADRMLAEEIESLACAHKADPIPERLIRGEPLNAALRLSAKSSVALSNDARTFVATSRALRLRSFSLAAVAIALSLGAASYGAWTYTRGTQKKDRQTAAALNKAFDTTVDTNKEREAFRVKAVAEVREVEAELDKMTLDRTKLAAEKAELEQKLGKLTEANQLLKMQIEKLRAVQGAPGAATAPGAPTP